MADLRNKEEYLREYAKILHKGNLQLAIDYWKARTGYSVSSSYIQFRVKLIASALIDITKYYNENKSLEDMGAKGIGKRLKRIWKKY